VADITIEGDAFGITVEQILSRLGNGVKTLTPPAVDKALELGERLWKSNAQAVLSKSYSRGGWGKIRSVTRFKSGPRRNQIKQVNWYGKTYKTGPYARSIRHHILASGGEVTEGEIGSPSLPGLAHLLEKGHGYYTAAPHVHIAPAADAAIKRFESDVERAVEQAINDA